MNQRDTLSSDDNRSSEPAFVSYATAERKKALAVCEAIEKRGTKCWISCRDVEPGENYQEAIVRHIRKAQAMVLVFSEAANNSDEIKKELSLASRYRVPVLALRIEDAGLQRNGNACLHRLMLLSLRMILSENRFPLFGIMP